MRERQSLPDQRTAVVRRRYSEFIEHACQVAAKKAERADQLAEMARQVLADRAELIEAITLAQTGRPTGDMPEWRSGEAGNRMVATFVPWVGSKALWAAIETVASTSFAATEREAAWATDRRSANPDAGDR